MIFKSIPVLFVALSIGACSSDSDTAASTPRASGNGGVAAAETNPAARLNTTRFTRAPGTPVKAVLREGFEAPQTDEWKLPDLLGQFDSLLPVPDGYPIPEIPSRLHDVATMRDGQYLRPRIPSARNTVDGRIGLGFTAYLGGRADLPNAANRSLNVMLYTPEKLRDRDVHYTQASDGSMDMMAKQVWWIPVTEFVPEASGLSPVMYAICDSTLAQMDHELYGNKGPGIHRNPYRVSNTAEAYDIHVLTGNLLNRREIFSFPLRIVVENAKTAQAHIQKIERLGDPVKATLPFEPITMFEPNVTGDGRLLVYRVSGTPGQGGGADALVPRTWTDAQGKQHTSQFDIVYAYNPPDSGFAPCDPRGWTSPKPITYAHYDPPVKARYGFAKFPFRDPEGKLIKPGEESGMTYPWIDHKGANLLFTAIYRLQVSDESSYATQEDFEMMQSLDPAFNEVPAGLSNLTQTLPASRPELRPHLMLPARHVIPVPGTCDQGCTNTTTREHASSTRGIGIAGLWTQGKMVILDGLMNATDFGHHAWDSGHRLMRLYHGQGGVVRVGNGRTNDDLKKGVRVDEFWPLNDSMIDSLENKFNMFPQWRPANPRDVVWTINNGRASTEVAFDDYMDPFAVVLSNMNASLSHNPLGPIKWLLPNTGDRLGRPLRIQNAATGEAAAIPAYGEVTGNSKGGTRIEPVALGGIEGKGLWMNMDTGLRYRIGQSPLPQLAQRPGNYFGLFLDVRDLPRSGAGELISGPTGGVGLKQTTNGLTLILRNASGKPLAELPLPGTLMRKGHWAHIGINRRPDNIEVWINGYLFTSVPSPAGDSSLTLQPGDWLIGANRDVPGFKGWIDNVEIFARTLLDAEEGCNRAHGSVIQADRGSAIAALFPAASHRRIEQATGKPGPFECATAYKEDGFGFLTRISPDRRMGHLLRNIKPLKFASPRPAENDNLFCIACHRSPHPSNSMSLAALSASKVPMQLDPRRQPLQPHPLATGVIPPHWPASATSKPSNAAPVKPNEDLWVDAVLHP
ncbi:MAG TPA: hypothetical protein VFV39_05460 [Limnobacter sp.]|nr:hypothetical protein [Limnobacter sp.]